MPYLTPLTEQKSSLGHLGTVPEPHQCQERCYLLAESLVLMIPRSCVPGYPLVLSNLHTPALSLIRRLGFGFAPDGWRVLAAHPDQDWLCYFIQRKQRMETEKF